MGKFIQQIEIEGLFGKRNIRWKDIYQDVNILVGINGSGKTTLLDILDAYYSNGSKPLKKYEPAKISGFPLPDDVYPITYLRSFDTPAADKRKSESPLMQELNNVVFQNKEGISFFNYRMKMLDYSEKAPEIKQNIDQLFEIVNKLFSDTGKKIEISKGNNSALIFRQDDDVIQLSQLSSGEKQLLLILLRVFLMEKSPAILLMDEPEISLHISWQRQLIDVLCELNPSCQIIISTHSPSIFGRGWGDNVVYMENLLKEK